MNTIKKISKNLTTDSLDKLSHIKSVEVIKYSNMESTKRLLDTFLDCSFKQIILEENPVGDTNILKKSFIDFDHNINKVSSSKFQTDVTNMKKNIGFIIKVNHNKIFVNFLFNDSDTNLITSILYAIHIFCHTFPHSYDDLTINICLDDNKRNLLDESRDNLDTYFNKTKKLSTGFTASGVTYRQSKLIILTKKEEIIKLLFHELCHYAELDLSLYETIFNVSWNIKNNKLNLAESYTEFLSIILNSMYSCLFLSNSIDTNYTDLFDLILSYEVEYSVLLTSTILNFYKYNHQNHKSFFVNDDNSMGKKYAPIYVWEYIFLRSILLLNLSEISDLPDWQLDNKTCHKIMKVLTNSNPFYNKLEHYMKINKPMSNISYTCIEINWDKM